MDNSTPIRILEKDNNRKGDLFTRLMADLFVALGYEQPRMNIHKTGRELDLSADHVLEKRRAIAECKATRDKDKIGGTDLNTLVGRLDVEGGKSDRAMVGYFISLAGFAESAIEQERERAKTGKAEIVLMDGRRVVTELVRGRILISKDKATELAGQCRAGLDSLDLDPESEILAHPRGWIWAIYFTQKKARSHVALIHADGTPLARAIANEVIAADRKVGGRLFELICLNPVPSADADDDPRVMEALAAYGRYLEAECGFILLDGMPADNDVGSKRLAIENLFVPLHLDLPKQEKLRQSVGAVLTEHPRLALLAAPGGGKSTLVKRLAIAYADPLRRTGDDELPNTGWLPLFFRCRELRELGRSSFADLLDALSRRELVRQHERVFRAAIDRALLTGRVLLLIDGLDEISDTGNRAAFVCTLRSALQAYPKIAFVLTSREAGFRQVAAHLAPICTQATLSPFDEEDIRRLSVAWYREVVGGHEKVREDAEALASSIVKNERVLRLATNPLLLTTLLLVKRWVGSLPTRRAVLYGKAVEVLLMTWNTEGHEPIPEEEALPQLCYVASAMMLEGGQKISRPRLITLLCEAREALPIELGYVRGTVEDFIHRVEDRSSLLMMNGHDVEDGQLVEVFEFRHLTFQEFLTAKSIVKGWHPARNPSDTLASVLESHFEEEAWQEVIPLAAVLGGKQTEALLERMTHAVRDLESDESYEAYAWSTYFALLQCLADEALARPATIRAAIWELVRLGNALEDSALTPILARGRYGPDLREVARRAFLTSVPGSSDADSALSITIWWQSVEAETPIGYTAALKSFVALLLSNEVLDRCEGALGGMMLCYFLKDRLHEPEWKAWSKEIENLGEILIPMLYSASIHEQLASSWALVWLGACSVWIPPAEPDLLGRLFFLWQKADNFAVQRMCGWAFASQPLAMRSEGGRCASISRDDLERVLTTNTLPTDQTEILAALVAAWYCSAVSDAEILRLANVRRLGVPGSSTFRTFRDLLDRVQNPRALP